MNRLTLPEELSAAQQEAAEQISAGPRGQLFGPFVPLLHSPELMTRLQLVGEHLRFGSVLDDDLFELVVLTVARHWDQQFEWGFHQPLALAAGVPEAVTERVGRGLRPDQGRPELAAAWAAAHALLKTGQVPDETYDALRPLGDEAIVELIVTVGYYTTLALTMNVVGMPAPDGSPRLPDADGTEAAR